MSTPADAADASNQGHAHDPHAAAGRPVDAAEQVVHLMPIVLPVVGGVLMFLLAFIAVHMA
ncbi:hypothetical protein [Xylophilus sp. ASV27]|uniref:hypothetical protein n=1 Tax=Xylophilus sp. ASV27 TaxID=2795129 RepID=UPI0018EB8E1F|nr:hypothetical protein [Xylophilus sp. ASV27]